MYKIGETIYWLSPVTNGIEDENEGEIISISEDGYMVKDIYGEIDLVPFSLNPTNDEDDFNVMPEIILGRIDEFFCNREDLRVMVWPYFMRDRAIIVAVCDGEKIGVAVIGMNPKMSDEFQDERDSYKFIIRPTYMKMSIPEPREKDLFQPNKWHEQAVNGVFFHCDHDGIGVEFRELGIFAYSEDGAYDLSPEYWGAHRI
jgi:hypothetical protein